MKVALRVLVCCLLSITGLSSITNAQIRIGPEAGMNFGMQNQENIQGSASTRNSTLKIGALAGVNIDIKILRKCYVQTGLLYVYDNIKFKNEAGGIPEVFGNPKEEINDDIHTLRIPLYIMYKSGYDGSGRFMAGVGPYVGYAFIANRNISMPTVIKNDNGEAVGYYRAKTNYELELGNDPVKDYMKNWDFGLNACIGYESNVGMFFRGNFNYGLQNLLPGSPSGNYLRNWGFGVSIGFNIGKDNW